MSRRRSYRRSSKAIRREQQPAWNFPLRYESLEERLPLSVTVNSTFDGIDQIQIIGSPPPDPIVSVGPEHLLSMVNTHIALYDKDGNQLEIADLDAPFMGNDGFFEDVDSGFSAFDPWTVYDRYSDRFFVMAVEVEAGGEEGGDEANLLIGVSTSDAPGDLDVAPGDISIDWIKVSLDGTADFGDGVSYINYPKIATDADSVYITGNHFLFGGGFQGQQVIRLDKADLLAGTVTVTASILLDDVEEITTPDQILQPAQSVDRLPGQPQLFVSVAVDFAGVDVWELDDDNALTKTATVGPVFNEFTGGVPQMGVPDTVESLSPRMMNAVWRDGAIWTTHTIEEDIINGSHAMVRWYEIATFPGGAFLNQLGDINPFGAYAFMPAINVDASGKMGIVYNLGASDRFIDLVVTGRQPFQPDGFTELGVVIKSGAAGYNPTAQDEERWGDYSGIALDPIDDHTFWAFGETALGSDTWTTSFAQFEVGPLPEDEFDADGGTNNSLATATVLGSLPKITLRDLTIDDSDDVDYFKITAQDTGKLIINAFFQDAIGNLNMSITDMDGDAINFTDSSTDNEQIIMPVVSQEVYFLRIRGVLGNTNVYDLEIENFPAPVPSGVHLDPASDSGMMNNDNNTFVRTPRFIIQADLQDFADMGIDILTADEANAGTNDGAAVQVFITNSTTGVSIEGFADPIGVSNILFDFTPMAALDESVYFVSAAVKIFDGQRDDAGQPDPAMGRSQLSEPLWVTIDNSSPINATADMLTASDTGMFDDDYVTSKMSPAFDGQTEANAKVRAYVNGELVGSTVAIFGGQWEITVEPLSDGEYNLSLQVEDLAGNISSSNPILSGDVGQPIDFWIDSTEPNTPYIDLLTDTGHSDMDNITNDNTPNFDLVGNDTVDGDGNPFPNDVKYRVYWRPGDAAGEVLVYDSFADIPGFTNLGVLNVTLTQTLNNPVGVPFPDGMHNFKLEIEDRAGNISHDFLLNVEIDATAPLVADPPDLLESSDTGMDNADDVTSKMEPAFSGISEVGASVLVFATDVATGTTQLVGEGVVGSDDSDVPLGGDPDDDLGVWEVTVEPLDDAEYDIFVQIEDWAGNVSVSDPLRIWVDTVEPNTPYMDLLTDFGHSDTDNITNDNTPNFDLIGNDTVDGNGNPFPNDLKYRVYWRPGDGTGEVLVYNSFPLLGFTTSGDINRTLTQTLNNPAGVPLPDGFHNFKLEVEDRAGNISHDFLLEVEIDTIPPPATINLLESSDTGMFDNDNVTNKMSPAFDGISEVNSTVRVFAMNTTTGTTQMVGIGTVESDESDGILGNDMGRWEVTVEPMADGEYDMFVEIEDWAGNLSESEELRIWIDTVVPNTPYLDLVDESDTGRHNFDNVTRDNQPTVSVTADDTVDGDGNPFWHDIKYRIYDRPDPVQFGGAANNGEVLLVDSFVTVPGLSVNGFFTEVLSTLADGVTPYTLLDGVHNLKLEVEDRAGNISHDFLLEVTIDTIAPAAPSIQIDPATSDTGVPGYPATIADRVTSDTETGFVGVAEANSIVRMWADGNPISNNVVNGSDRFQGLTVALPEDGNLAFPDGQWNLAGKFDLNDPNVGFPLDGLRQIATSAEDLAGNESEESFLDIFLDTQGPQLADVFVTGFPGFNLFDPKSMADGPTPRADSLSIDIRDLPNRVTSFLYDALQEEVALEPGHYQLVGDHVGVIAISNVSVNQQSLNGSPATATIRLDFFEPLPDDRYTLTISDALVDPAGNALDGETGLEGPIGAPDLPSGDGVRGGDFVARFTVDSRPEIGVWSTAGTFLDINQNFIFDPDGPHTDDTNRDFVFQFGVISDAHFAGNFAPAGAGSASGFDKIGSYGFDNSTGLYRFLLDFDHDGIVDFTSVSGFQINAYPVAGDFAPAHPGDEIGLFDGTTWHLDTNGDNILGPGDAVISSAQRGLPIVGDFDGDGDDDLGTYDAGPNLFTFDLNNNGTIDDSFSFGFNGFRDRPIAGDINLDGIDDIGLFVPRGNSQLTGVDVSEWYILVSDDIRDGEDEGELPSRLFNNGIGGAQPNFSPDPLGNDIFAQFGDQMALPIFGNFDPPTGSQPSADPLDEYVYEHNTDMPQDVDDNGLVNLADIMMVVDALNADDPQAFVEAMDGTYYMDVSGDQALGPIDALQIINVLNSSTSTASASPSAQSSVLSAPEPAQVGAGEDVPVARSVGFVVSLGESFGQTSRTEAGSFVGLATADSAADNATVLLLAASSESLVVKDMLLTDSKSLTIDAQGRLAAARDDLFAHFEAETSSLFDADVSQIAEAISQAWWKSNRSA